MIPIPVAGIRAQPVETVRLVIRRKGESLPSEYERLMIALEPLLAGRTSPDRFDEEQYRDLTFAARETREDRTLIETVSPVITPLPERFVRVAEPPEAALLAL